MCLLSHIDTSVNYGHAEEPPKTCELTLQKIDSFGPYEYFVYMILQNGEYMNGKGWRERALNVEYTTAFDDWVHTKKIQGPYGDNSRKIGNALALAGGCRHRERMGKDLPYYRIMPPFDDARKIFEKSIKGEIDWD